MASRPRLPATDQVRIDTLATLAANDGNLALTSRQTGYSRRAIRDWRDKTLGSVALLASDMVPTLEQRLPVLAVKTLDAIEDIAFGNLSDVATWDSNGHVIVKASADLSVAQAAIIS